VSIGGFSRIGALCKIGMNSVVAPYITLPEGFQCGPLSLVEQPPMD
jgi:acetyltransferase-like isoleucine patch superfamily enzyme